MFPAPYTAWNGQFCGRRQPLTAHFHFVLPTSKPLYLRQRIRLKCVPHVHHYYFTSFNQSDHCFLALSLPLPSSFLKLSFKYCKNAKLDLVDVLVFVNIVLAWAPSFQISLAQLHCVPCFPRQLFSIASYFFFFYNILIGLISRVFRFLKALLQGIVFMSPIDRTCLMQGYQSWDGGNSFS